MQQVLEILRDEFSSAMALSGRKQWLRVVRYVKYINIEFKVFDVLWY